MGRISHYILDEIVTLDDFVIGTDAENSQITKNYLIRDILDLVPGLSGGNVEIDFGSVAVSSMEFTILDDDVLDTSSIIAAVAYDKPTGKDLDEITMDTLYIVCGQASLGSFKMFIRSTDGSYLSDKFKINYSISK